MKIDLLGARVDAIGMDESIERVAGMIRRGRPHWLLTMNPEYLYRAQFAKELLELADRADMVTPDGAGIAWACRVAGHPAPERVTGIDLMLRLAERAAVEGWRVYLLGAAPGVAEEAAGRLCQNCPGLPVVGFHHGYFSEDEEKAVVTQIRKAGTDLLFVALGAPRQEKWIDKYLEETGAKVAMGVGGSFDVVAGRVQRAPRWVRDLRLEWLYRLLSQPSRWRRQVVLPLFAWMIITRVPRGRGCQLFKSRGEDK